MSDDGVKGHEDRLSAPSVCDNAPVKPSLASSRQPEPDDEGTGKMGFLDHLEELRARLIRSCLAVGAGMIAAFVFRDRIAAVVLEPTFCRQTPRSWQRGWGKRSLSISTWP
jgi:Sec-independent protein secretion pathway component TatC